MDAFMNPIIPAKPAPSAVEVKGVARGKDASNFSDYMEKKMAAKRREGKDILGGEQRPRAAEHKTPADKSNDVAQKTETMDPDDVSSIAGLLAQFINEIKDASQDTENTPGAWAVDVSEVALLQQIAADAGMSEAQLSALVEKMNNQDGSMELPDFLDFFARHFEGLENEKPVTVPEPELPMLEIFLQRLGAAPEDIQKLGEHSITGDNNLDLGKFLEGLKDITADKTTTLSDVESEQLQDLLHKAGVSEPLQRALLPERFPTWQNPDLEAQPVELSLERLKNLLSQGVQEVKSSQLQADLPAFLSDLENVLKQAGFAEQKMDWSPAVQETVASIYENLMESVDMAKVQIQKGDGQTKLKLGDELPEELTDEQIEEVLIDTDSDSLATDVKRAVLSKANVPDKDASDHGQNLAQSITAENQSTTTFQGEAVAAVTAPESSSASQQTPQVEARDFVPSPRMPVELQQQTFERLTVGVIRGLQNQEHHLIMKLYPKELGEVRVELLVREENVAVNFAMENSKVKEIMENNMNEFRDNLERQGFSLEECMVSVDQQDDGRESWQEFTKAWQDLSAARKESLADLPEDVFYHHASRNQVSEDGVDLFA